LNDVILARLGLRIKGINETTRDRVATAIKNGLDAGHSAAELGDDVAETAAFDEYRAELIARTESARVLNDSQLETFREFDVEQVTAIDGDDDEVCADRNGQTFDIDEAMDIEDHPNGTLDWVPVVKAKATHSPAPAKAHDDTLARLQAQVAQLEARIAAQDSRGQGQRPPGRARGRDAQPPLDSSQEGQARSRGPDRGSDRAGDRGLDG
jgi:SPP1 gp7 family putative phage head morphogenesis protein